MNSASNPNTARKNAFLDDAILFRYASSLPPALLAGFEEIGAFVSSREAQDFARMANIYRPKLRQVNEWGDATQFIEMHPAYHALQRRSKQAGLATSLWELGKVENGVRYQARAIRLYLMAGLETGHLNEVALNSAAIAALIGETELFQQWQNVLLSRQHDFSIKPIMAKKSATLTFAFEDAGHKIHSGYFVSKASLQGEGSMHHRDVYSIDAMKTAVINPLSDGYFVTAQYDGKMSCFLIPRLLDDGSYNGDIVIDHLLMRGGEASAAEAVISFKDSHGWLIGQIGDGEKVMRDIETMTCFDQAIISAGVIRAALYYGVQYFRRDTVKQPLSPLTERIFADIALDIAGAQCLIMRLARAFDNAANDRNEAAFARIMTPIVAMHINQLVVPIVGEVIAQLGNDAFYDDSRLAIMLKDAPIRAMKGMGSNDWVSDTIRMTEKAPGLFQELLNSIASDIGAAGPKTVEILKVASQVAASNIGAGRLFVEQMAYAAAAAAIRKTELEYINAAYVESRLGGQWRSCYGMLSTRHNAGQILDALYPML